MPDELTTSEKLEMAQRVRDHREPVDETREKFLRRLETSSDQALERTIAELQREYDAEQEEQRAAEAAEQEAAEARARELQEQQQAEFDGAVAAAVEKELTERGITGGSTTGGKRKATAKEEGG